MKWNTLDLEKKLRANSTVPTPTELMNFLDDIWTQQHLTEVSILKRIKEQTPTSPMTNYMNSQHLEAENIFHINDIKKLCIDYRLRFLSTHYFKGAIPHEAISKLKHLEKLHDTAFRGFKIIAPSKMFTLSNANDPLLFIPIQNDYYYLVHKWGDDLAWYRKIWAWCFKSFENLALLCFLLSITITFLLPKSTMALAKNETTGLILEFLFVFKAIVAITLYYGFAKGKNFNTAIWNSHYFNA